MIVDRLLRKAREARHLAAARRVLATPPIVPTDDRVVIFSMIGTRVLLPYLVAVKSLHAQLGMGRVMLLDDGSLTDADKRILAAQCGSPAILRLADVDTGDCPQGGTWERLLTLLDLRADDYVIQLDSDTVTVGNVPEVRQAILDNRSFLLLGGPDGEERGIQPLPDFVAYRYPDGLAAEPAHIQALIESRYGRYPDAAAHRYVRGCSGFAGFARGGPSGRAEAARFSRNAEALVGPDVWARWGSEQVTSNFLLANEPGARTLPYARYCNYWKQAFGGEEAFLHFLGTHRYSDAAYREATRIAIDHISSRSG